MITLDAVRAAVLSDQPWMRLDELVRAEMAAGKRTKQIYEDLIGMADEIDALPGLSEDGSDAFGDALDALTGMCHRDCRYVDPPDTTLPTEGEIAKLPRWARVAFAARCARRVLPLYTYFWKEAPAKQSLVLELACATAEAVASGSWSEDIEDVNVAGMAHAAHVADSEAAAYGTASYAAAAASFAADSTFRAMLQRADEAAYSASAASDEAAKPLTDLAPIIRRDFDHLARLAESQHWTDDTPVPPEVFGPLWPEGPPKGWPPVAAAPPRAELPLELFARGQATEQMIGDEAVNLFNALNRYHIARGGVRLTLDQLRSLLPALVPAEA